MDVELKVNTKISYICAYIKKKFPFYVNSMEQIDLMKLANVIQITPEIKNINFDELKSGSMDSFIDILVDEYAKEHLSDIWENFSNFCKYIEEVISNKYKNKNCSAFLKDVSLEIALSTNSKVGFDKLMSGRYDQEYLNKYLNLLGQIKDRYFKYMKSIVNKTGLNLETEEYIFNQIFDDMLEKYDNDEVYSVDFVKKTFRYYYRDLTNKITKRVLKVINEIELIFGIPERVIVMDIVKMATITGEISGVKIINGQLDVFIRNYAESKRIRGYVYDDNYLIQYIFNVLRKEADEEIISGELYNYSVELLNMLLGSECRYTRDDIANGICDEIIIKKYNEKYHPVAEFDIKRMRTQSVKDKKSKGHDFVKYNKIKRFIQKEIAKFLSVVVLGSLLGLAAGNYIENRDADESIALVETLTASRNYYVKLPVYLTGNREIIENSIAVESLIEYYDALQDYGEKYTILCFYDAYKSGLSLAQMDNLCYMVKNSISNNSQYRKLYKMVAVVDCYVDFIYDSLIEMGCKEIKDEKYLNALVAYKQSFHGNVYGIASDGYLNEEDEYYFNKMIELYEEYSRNLQIQLGDKIKNENNPEIALSSGLGRGV